VILSNPEGREGRGLDAREWRDVVVWEDLLSNRRVRQLSLMEEGRLSNGILRDFFISDRC
jgi:hypothetical protein